MHDRNVFSILYSTIYVWDLLGLSNLHSWVLSVGMGVCAWGRLESHGANGAFVEDLTVSTLDVWLKGSDISKDHTTVDTSEDEQNKRIFLITFYDK